MAAFTTTLDCADLAAFISRREMSAEMSECGASIWEGGTHREGWGGVISDQTDTLSPPISISYHGLPVKLKDNAKKIW